MNNNLTELVFILDKSGSMCGKEKDSVGGFNSMIEDQKKIDSDTYVSTILFSNSSVVVHDRVDIQDVKPLTLDDYRVGGCTALLDAIGGAIHHIGNIHRYARKEDIPARTLFVIMTDGLENASRRYSVNHVRNMIELEKAKYGWEFLYLAANIDAIGTAGSMGIAPERAVNFNCDSQGLTLGYDSISSTLACYRRAVPLNDNWKKDIENDYNTRNQK